MGSASKIAKYTIVFMLGYYIGIGGCSDYIKEKRGELEKKVIGEYYGRTGKSNK